MAGGGQIAWYCSRALQRYRFTQLFLSDSLFHASDECVQPVRSVFTRNYKASTACTRAPRNRKSWNHERAQRCTGHEQDCVTITTAAGSSVPGPTHACLKTADTHLDQKGPQPIPGDGAQAGVDVHTPGQAITLDGRECSAAWLHELRPSVTEVTKALGRAPSLCVIHVGDRPDASVYVRKKEEACEQMHVSSKVVRLPATVEQEELYAAIDAACADSEVDGVLVQLPLPPHVNEHDVMERVDPRKDVDGFHPLNMGRMLARNAPPRFVPATALGCMQLLKRYDISVSRKHVVVVGDSNIVGTPLSVLLRDAGAGTVTVCHRIAYDNLFKDRTAPQQRAQLRADACLPRLPGPYSPGSNLKEGHSHWLPASMPNLKDGPVGNTTATAGVLERTSGASQSLTKDAEGVAHHEGVSARRGARAPALHELSSGPGSGSGSSACSFSSQSDSAEDSLRQLSEVLQERVWGASCPTSKAGAWDDMQLAALTRTADILVVAVGYPELVRSDWVKRGSTVLDVGINIVPHDNADASGGGTGEYTEQGTIVGDVARRDVSRVASALTPVPGGVGPMTIAALIHNVILAARYRTKIQKW